MLTTLREHHANGVLVEAFRAVSEVLTLKGRFVDSNGPNEEVLPSDDGKYAKPTIVMQLAELELLDGFHVEVGFELTKLCGSALGSLVGSENAACDDERRRRSGRQLHARVTRVIDENEHLSILA
jgi:hypothetical protein